MRVIEQLIQHFWARELMSREDIAYLIRHGFVRDSDLPGWLPPELEPAPHEPPAPPDDRWHDEARAREAEELEDELAGRQAGGKKGGKKQKPAGHNLAPAAAALNGHYADRAAYPALVELAERVKPSSRVTDWHQAARLVGAATARELEPALVGLLNHRPRALAELWHWFNLEPLFEWATDEENAGPVADALGRLLTGASRSEVGRIGQLMKAAEVQLLPDLLAARRAFLGVLPALYHAHFGRLFQWLVPPTGAALGCWPALPWAFVLVYNAKQGTAEKPAVGYEVNTQQLPFNLFKLAWATAYPMEPVAVRDLLATRLRFAPEPSFDPLDWAAQATFDRTLFCPYTWRI
ncbi:MAG TPA: hypothetical protein VMZ71_15360 [Gemmataceae bacterium]|nr:hypothetical protein [Gemmataceae bacterium]